MSLANSSNMGHLIDSVSRRLRPDVQIGSCRWPAYRLAVEAGVTVGVLTALCLTQLRGLSLSWMAATAAAGVVVSLLLAVVTKVLVGQERFTFYHYQIVVLVAGAVLLKAGGKPVLSYLDLVAVALALTLACGRIGCLMAGCCHGRPHRWGICYGTEHAAHGFCPDLVGVRLFPVQAVESIWMFGVSIAGSAMSVKGQEPGETLCVCLLGHALGRFGLEFMRGDAARPYLFGYSEAQWTAGVVVVGIFAGEQTGVFPLRQWHIAAALCFLVVLICGAAAWQIGKTHRFRDPKGLAELAQAVAQIIAPDRSSGGESKEKPIHVTTTSRGIRLSGGWIESKEGLCHYALSASGDAMSRRAAETLGWMICHLQHPGQRMRVIAGEKGVFHLLIGADARRGQ